MRETPQQHDGTKGSTIDVPPEGDVIPPHINPAAGDHKPRRRHRGCLITLGLMLLFSLIAGMFLIGVIILVGVMAFMAGRQRLAIAREMADTPTATIRGAAQGRVELKGTLTNEKPIKAPISEEPCAFWHLTLETLERHGGPRRGGTYWRKIATAASHEDFVVLEDRTGRCHIAIPEMELKVKQTGQMEGTATELGALRRQFTRLDDGQQIRPGAQLRVVEQRIDVGEPIYVIGRFETLSSLETPFDELWFDKTLRQGAAAPAWALKLAQHARHVAAPERETLKERWRVRMRELEGIDSDALLAGTVSVNLMRDDWRLGRVFPLIVSNMDEVKVSGSIRRQALICFLTAAGCMLAAFGVLYLIYPEQAHWLIALF